MGVLLSISWYAASDQQSIIYPFAFFCFVMSQYFMCNVEGARVSMAIAFEAGTHLKNFYFKGLNVDGVGGIFAAAVVIFVFAVMSELLKVANRNVRLSFNRSAAVAQGGFVTRLPRLFAMTVSFCVEVFMAYVLMLAAMTCNVWLILAIVIGAGLGFYVSIFLVKVAPVNMATAVGGDHLQETAEDDDERDQAINQ